MDQVLPQIGQLSETMTGLLSQINGELGSQVDIARGRANDSKQAASLWYRTATTMRDLLSDLLNTGLTSAGHSQAHAVNRSRFDTAFGLARGGDVEAARDIPELAKAYLASAQANASSSLEYRRIAAAVQGQVNFLAGISELEGANEDVLIPVAIGMAIIGEAIASYLGAGPTVSTGIVALAAYIGPRGAEVLLTKWLVRTKP